MAQRRSGPICISCMLPEHPGLSCGEATRRDNRQSTAELHKITDSGLHPAPTEFSTAQIVNDPILHYFHYSHLPPHLRATSRLFMILAHTLVTSLPRNPERTVALRKLLEAKDAAVRANLPAPSFEGSYDTFKKRVVASEQPIGEPVETGGHDEDRDGPVPFDC